MATLTLGDYNAGTDTLSAWWNPTYAWDGNIATFATISYYPADQARTLVFTGRPDSCPDYIITKVEIGIYHKETQGNGARLLFQPKFGGVTYGSYFVAGPNYPEVWTWVDITTGTNAPSPWTHTDIDGLDIELWASSGSIDTWYVGEVAIRIEYTLPAGPTNLKTVNGLAKASVKTIKGLAIGSVKSWNGLT